MTIIGIAFATDRNAFRRIGSPKFWLFSIIILLTAGSLLGKNAETVWGIPFSADGLIAGLVMNLRAVGVVLGIALISRYVTREGLFDFTGRIGLGHYVPAFSTAMGTLPRMTAVLKEGGSVKRWWHWDSIADILLLARELALEPAGRGENIYGITGARKGGKSSLLLEIADRCKEEGVRYGGFIQQFFPQEGSGRPSYYALHLTTGETIEVARELEPFVYQFSEMGFEQAGRWLADDIPSAEVCLVDEFGALEASGQGHYHTVMPLLQSYPEKRFVIALRKDRIETLSLLLGLEKSRILDIDGDESEREPFIQRIIGKCN